MNSPLCELLRIPEGFSSRPSRSRAIAVAIGLERLRSCVLAAGCLRRETTVKSSEKYVASILTLKQTGQLVTDIPAMAKDKKGSKAAAPATKSQDGGKPLEAVKAGRVAKPAEAPKVVAKDTAKKSAKSAEKQSKKSKKVKEPTPEPSSEEDEDTSDESASSEDEKTEAKSVPKANGAAKALADEDDSSDASDDDEEVVAPKSNGLTNGHAKAANDEDDDDSSDASDEEVDAKAGAQKVVADDEDDDEDDEDEKPASKLKANGEAAEVSRGSCIHSSYTC